jgi:plasmid stabilization system protein ParE
MERVKLYFHSEAVAELEAAFQWYIERSPQAAERFLDAFAAAMATIRRNPQLCGA